jgi:copper type II ascorbate-dependent monooxygenase-like protein
MTRWHFSSLAAAALLASACGSGDDDGPLGTSGAALTYWQDVAPVLYERCVDCHREGGIGPFRLDDYESARTWAAASKDAVVARRMPPWLATADGSCNTFRGSSWLSDEEVRVISAWADSEKAEGAPRSDLAPPARPGLGERFEIASPEFAPVPLGTTYAENDEYRCFLIDPQLTSDRFLTGYDVTPGNNDALVHHVLVIPVEPAAKAFDGRTNLEVMTAYDQESPDRDGWPCFSGAGDGVTARGNPVTWAPGQGAVDYPANIGVRVPAGSLFVMQVHYNLSDPALRGVSDRTKVQLRLTDRVEREGVFLDIDPFLGSLSRGKPQQVPPGLAAAPLSWQLPYEAIVASQLGSPLSYLDVYGVFPHMHERGLSLDASIGRADGSEQCTLRVPRWDFGWQLIYFYDEPLRFGPGDSLRTTCTFDTRGLDSPLLPGWSTQNEMCLTGLLLALPPGETAAGAP